jgi:hypothetical protein
VVENNLGKLAFFLIDVMRDGATMNFYELRPASLETSMFVFLVVRLNVDGVEILRLALLLILQGGIAMAAGSSICEASATGGDREAYF